MSVSSAQFVVVVVVRVCVLETDRASIKPELTLAGSDIFQASEVHSYILETLDVRKKQDITTY